MHLSIAFSNVRRVAPGGNKRVGGERRLDERDVAVDADAWRMVT